MGETPLILFATETGNAQDVADTVARQCRRIGLRCRLQDMETYSPAELISESLIIFIVSTTGSGVEPRSMTALWSMLLRSDLPPDLFEDIHFARFCWPAKKLSRRLLSLGATEICARGEGDDQHMLGTEGALDPWIESLLGVLQQLLELPDAKASKDPLGDDPVYHRATLKTNLRVTASDWFQDVRHFEFTFDEDVQYNPGDVAVIHPRQSEENVEAFLTSMGWGNISDAVYTISHIEKDQSMPDHIPERTTLRTLFTRYLDFNAVPRRTFFQYLRYFNTDEQESDKLDEFLSPEGADELYDYCHKVRRTIVEVLAEFHSSRMQLPKEYIFDVFPPLRPREFSIASDLRKEVQLCVAIVKYKTRLKVPRKGVCTAYLSTLRPGDKVTIGLRRGYITLPKNGNTPIICIGPGTGVAPMRALIQRRILEGIHCNTLYFGCRSATKDQHYGSEWDELAKEGKLAYCVAYSRDGPEGVKRTYVQDLIEHDAERMWKLIGEQNAYVYISGSSNKMPTAVKAALALCEYIQAMEREGRLTEECWS
ncbi:riboflavin synthase domain-like protein [Mucidula mucida]|nr:riboflavin synthase domain-like protein [Mucidula mucida]